MSSFSCAETDLLSLLGGWIRKDDQRRIEMVSTLHCDIAGSLVACSSIGEMMRHEIGRDCSAERLLDLLGNLEASLRQALRVVRGISEQQFPPVLKAFGLNVALQQLVKKITPDFSGSLLLNTTGDEPGFDLGARLSIFRMVESLLRVCTKQADVSCVELSCRSAAGRLEITLQHDGSKDLWVDEPLDDLMLEVKARCHSRGVLIEFRHAQPAGGSSVLLTADEIPS